MAEGVRFPARLSCCTGAQAGNALGQLGNSPLRGNALFAHLNDRVGLPKLHALFTPDELGRLATIGRAAGHLKEQVPGTSNPSGTASTFLNAQARAAGKEKGWIGKSVDAAVPVGG